MIILKSSEEVEKLRASNLIVAEVMQKLGLLICPGVTTGDLEKVTVESIASVGAKPAFKGYRGYQHALCTSVNSEVVHGIPGTRRLEEGDIVGVDCGVLYDGFYGDMAVTFGVGRISEQAQKLLGVTRTALYKGIEKAVVGNRLYDISAAIQSHVEENGFSVVRDFVGHGVGTSLHEDPQVPNFGTAGTGVKLRAGMVLALEPMVNAGGWKTKILDDNWTVVTADESLSAHFEHSVAIMDKGPYVLSEI